jgi:hypothetical protein
LDQSRQGEVRPVEGGGEQSVRGPPAWQRRAAQYGGAQQRMGEADPCAVTVERARALGGQQAVGVDAGQPGRAQQQGGVGADAFRFVFLRRRGEEQQEPGVRGQRLDAGGVRVQDALRAGQGVRQRGVAGELVGREPRGERGQQPRVARCLPAELVAYERVGPAFRQPVDQCAGGRVVERSEPQARQSGEGVPAAGIIGRGEQDGGAVAGGEAAGGEAERDARVAVPGVGVVDAEQQRAVGAESPEQLQQRGGRCSRAGHVVGRSGQGSGRRAEQGVESAVRQQGFGGGGARVEHRPLALVADGVPRECAAAEAGRPGDHEGAAAAVAQTARQLVEEGEFTASAVQPKGTVHGRRWIHARQLTPA